MKYCSRNHQNPDDAIFCNECGEKLLNKSTSNKCPKCGSSNPKDAVFCHNCGSELKEKEKKEAIRTKETEYSPSTTKPTSTQYGTTSSSTDEPIPLGCGIAMIVVGGILIVSKYLDSGFKLIFFGILLSIGTLYKWLKKWFKEL